MEHTAEKSSDVSPDSSPAELTRTCQKTCRPEYSWERNAAMKSNLHVYARFHIGACILRFFSSSFEPVSPLTSTVLLPYLLFSIAVMVGISAYVSRLLHIREEDRHNAVMQDNIRRHIRLSGGVISAHLLLDLAVVACMETDRMMILVNYVAVLLLLQQVSYHFIKSTGILAALSVLFIAIFWYGCMGYCEKPVQMMTSVVLATLIGLYIISQRVKREGRKYVRAWCAEHSKELCEQFLQFLSEPVMIVEKNKLLHANPMCADRFGITPQNYLEKLRMFVRPNYRSLLETVTEGLENRDTFFVPETDYRLCTDSAEGSNVAPPSFFRVCITTSAYRNDRKALSIIFKEVVNETAALPVPYPVLHQLRSAVSSVRGVLSHVKGIKGIRAEAKMKISEANALTRVLSNELSLAGYNYQTSSKGIALVPRLCRTNLRQLLKRVVRLAYLLLGEKRSGVEISLSESDNLISEICIDERRVEEVLTAVLNSTISRIIKGQIELKAWHSEDDHMIELAISDTETSKGTYSPYSRQQAMPKSSLSSTTVSAYCYYTNRSEELLFTTQLLPAKQICQQLGGELLVDCTGTKLAVINIRLPYETDLGQKTKAKRVPDETLMTEMEERKGTCPAVVPEMEFHLNAELLKFGSLSKRTSRMEVEEKKERGVKFIVADDIALNRAVLTQILDKIGISWEEAKDGEEAVELAREALTTCPGTSVKKLVMLMDIEMPNMDGIEAVHKIREIKHERGCELYIVATTVHSDEEEDVKRYMETGFDRCMPKPVRQSDIRQLLLMLGVN